MVTYDQYVTDCLLHLTDTTTYTRLSKEHAHEHASHLQRTISNWLTSNRPFLDRMDAKYIWHHMHTNRLNPFGQFYVTYKIHKGMKNNTWPTRLVCSDVSSIQHGLGKWVDQMLQPIARAPSFYFKDSFAFKQLIDRLTLPSHAQLFTSDATSMYTNIQTGRALETISDYLRSNENSRFHHYNATTLIEALQIIFRNNVIQFGDTYWQQISGTGMGISPAPPNLHPARSFC